MSALEILESAQFVVDQEGRLSAVQIRIEAWELLLDWLENLEDRALVKEALPRLREGPKKAGALRWEAVRAEWDLSKMEPGHDAT
ncbi:MAG: hypothetical protein ACE5F6_19595 [Anaerolineae bacterium]